MKIKIVFLVFVILIIANAFVFFNRKDFAFTKQISYTDLYPTITSLPVKDIITLNDSTLQYEMLPINKKKVFWHEFIDGKFISKNIYDNPIIHLKEGVHSYTLIHDNSEDSLYVRIEYLSKFNNNKSSPFTAIYKSNITDKTIDFIESDKDIFENINTVELTKVHSILFDTLSVKNTMPDSIKVNKILCFLHKKTFAAVGIPSDSVLALNSYQQYNAATEGKKIWCGIYSKIFSMFSASANIKCRSVGMFNTNKNFAGNNHVFNEYFDKQKRQWIAVDVMYNNALYYNANGKILNGVDVKNIAENDSSVIVKQYSGDSLLGTNFSKMPIDFYDLYGLDKNLIYTFSDTNKNYDGNIFKRIKNFFFKNFRYQFYSDTKIFDNKNFYIKQFLFFLLFAVIILMVSEFLLKSFKKKYDRV